MAGSPTLAAVSLPRSMTSSRADLVAHDLPGNLFFRGASPRVLLEEGNKEVDFIVRSGRSVIGIEVKSGGRGMSVRPRGIRENPPAAKIAHRRERGTAGGRLPVKARRRVVRLNRESGY